jgi:hypothetical protein
MDIGKQTMNKVLNVNFVLFHSVVDGVESEKDELFFSSELVEVVFLRFGFYH